MSFQLQRKLDERQENFAAIFQKVSSLRTTLSAEKKLKAKS
jgi:hypothetical protein